jgi:nucleoid DNA-binding protein
LHVLNFGLNSAKFFKIMPSLTKRELVVRISNETGLSQLQVFGVIQKTLDYITAALAEGKNVELRNFGVFDVRLTKPRVGRNPAEPEREVPIPPRATVRFKSGKTMRQRVLLRTEELVHNPPPKRTRQRKNSATPQE